MKNFIFILTVILCSSCITRKITTSKTDSKTTSNTESIIDAKASVIKPASKDEFGFTLDSNGKHVMTIGGEKVTIEKTSNNNYYYTREKPADTSQLMLMLRSQLKNELSTSTESTTTVKENEGIMRSISRFLNDIGWIIIVLVVAYVIYKVR